MDSRLVRVPRTTKNPVLAPLLTAQKQVSPPTCSIQTYLKRSCGSEGGTDPGRRRAAVCPHVWTFHASALSRRRCWLLFLGIIDANSKKTTNTHTHADTLSRSGRTFRKVGLSGSGESSECSGAPHTCCRPPEQWPRNEPALSEPPERRRCSCALLE